MQFLLCNGSPRGKTGNSERIIDGLAEGLNAHENILIEKVLLNRTNEHSEAAARLAGADCAIIVFPLYTDAMPGMVMAFFEELTPHIGSLSNLSLGFIVQSGFPEKIQSLAVEKYLERLTELLGARYSGTAIFGGGMGMRKKRMELIRELGASFVPGLAFDPVLLERTTGFVRLSPVGSKVMGVVASTALLQTPWIRSLKANGAYGKRDARPYEPQPPHL
jgi:NAD(P)H-dependent FMN reductase